MFRALSWLAAVSRLQLAYRRAMTSRRTTPFLPTAPGLLPLWSKGDFSL